MFNGKNQTKLSQLLLPIVSCFSLLWLTGCEERADNQMYMSHLPASIDALNVVETDDLREEELKKVLPEVLQQDLVQEYDFGIVPTKSQQRHTFTITKTCAFGSKLLSIKSTCGCLVGEVGKKEVTGVDEAYSVPIVLFASSRPMDVMKELQVCFEGQNGSTETHFLRISAKVRDQFSVFPSQLDLGDLAIDGCCPFDVRLQNFSDTKLYDVQFDSDDGFRNVIVSRQSDDQLEDGERQAWKVHGNIDGSGLELGSNWLTGTFRGNRGGDDRLSRSPLPDDNPIATMRCHVSIIPEYRVSPRQAFWGEVCVGQTVEQRLFITFESDKKAEVSGIRLTHDFSDEIKASLDTSKDRLWKLKLTLTPRRLRSGPVSGKVSVVFKEGEVAREIIIPTDFLVVARR
jgi:Protein of unknown function (DUF1573)